MVRVSKNANFHDHLSIGSRKLTQKRQTRRS